MNLNIRKIPAKIETVTITEAAVVEASSISVIDVTKTAKTTMRMVKKDKIKEMTEDNNDMSNDQMRQRIIKHLLAMVRM